MSAWKTCQGKAKVETASRTWHKGRKAMVLGRRSPSGLPPSSGLRYSLLLAVSLPDKSRPVCFATTSPLLGTRTGGQRGSQSEQGSLSRAYSDTADESATCNSTSANGIIKTPPSVLAQTAISFTCPPSWRRHALHCIISCYKS